MDNYQYAFNGLVFGKGTNFRVERVEGLLSMAEVKNYNFPLEGADGSVPGYHYLGERIIRFSIWITGTPATIENNIAQFQAAFVHRQEGEGALLFQRPGQPEKSIYCRCTKRDIISEYSVPHGKANAAVELVASDPLIYSGTQQSVTGTGTVTVNNTSGRSIWPILRIAVASADDADLVVKSITDGNKSLIWAVDNIDSYEINTRTKSIYTYPDALPRGNVLDPASQWFQLLPGTNTFEVTDRTAPPPPLTVLWQNAEE